MTTITPIRFYCTSADLAHGVHKLNVDTLKLVLTNSPPDLNYTVLDDIEQIAAEGGYIQDGFTLNVVSSEQILGVYRLKIEDYYFTATGDVPAHRYAVVYNASTPTKALLFYGDQGETIIDMSKDEESIFDFRDADGCIVI